MSVTAVNPATGETLREYPLASEEEVDRVLDLAVDAQAAWSRTGFEERAEPMREAGRLLRDRAREYGTLMSREMGKPVQQAEAEARKCARVCDYYAEHARDFLAPDPVETEARKSFVAYRPIGVVLAIMPWNFPFWQVLRFAAPNLMAGNAGILKHAPNVPECAQKLEALFREAGFPEHLFRNLRIDVERTGRVVEDPRIRGVTLTGSVGAGSSVAERAGAAIKKTVLELGGSDPYLVLDDADLDRTVEACVFSRLINSGQSCIAAKRFVVVEPLVEAFTERLVERMERVVVGDPLDEETEVGPQARRDLRDELHRQVEDSVEAGARCLLGGQIPERPGFFYPPTVLTGVGPGMPAYEEELFGPVASVIAAGDEEEAIRIANDSPYGLGAAVFTSDRKRGERIAVEEIDAGSCFVNAYVRSDPRLPFGGVKASGYGRELSPMGIREFVNAKTVWIE